MATVLATMPDLWQRVLIEHSQDADGSCVSCRGFDGEGAIWPCHPWRIAREAQDIYHGLLPGEHASFDVPMQRSPDADSSDPFRRFEI